MATRRQFVKAGAAAAMAGLAGQARGQLARPNVLFVAVDDLNHHLGCYGHPQVKTPHIDRLASRGVRFDRSYCQYPVCNPSRSSTLTGLRPDTTRVTNNTTSLLEQLPGVMTLPHWFRQHGYHTAGIGKTFHDGPKFGDPAAYEVEEHFAPTAEGRQGERRNLTGDRVKWCWWMAAEGGDLAQPDGQNAAKAIELMRTWRDEPWFIALGFHKPHDPFIAPKAYFDLYPLESITPPEPPADRSPELPQALPGGGLLKEFGQFGLQEKREFTRAYWAGISYMDACLGRVLDELERSGQRERTMILFYSDHGYHLGDRGWWNKVTLFELCANAPVIAAGPGLATGRSTTSMIEFIDFFPTLTDLCGLPSPAGLQGRSFKPVLADPATPHKAAAYTQVDRGQGLVGRTVRTADFRYTEWGDQAAELYDHRSDPGEWHNLADSPAHRDIVAQHRRLLREDGPEGWQRPT